MPNEPKHRSIESFGVGQSGYTAGRDEDPALATAIEVRNLSFPLGSDQPLGLDERWTGRGGPRWAPETPPKKP